MKVMLLFFLSFSSVAQVVCRDPGSAGDEGSEAGAVSEHCNSAVIAGAGGAADRDVNVQEVINEVKTASISQAEDSSSGEGSAIQ